MVLLPEYVRSKSMTISSCPASVALQYKNKWVNNETFPVSTLQRRNWRWQETYAKSWGPKPSQIRASTPPVLSCLT